MDDREMLIRETYELNRELLYRKLYGEFFDDAEWVRECPDVSGREAALRGYAKEYFMSYGEYCESAASASTEGLAHYRNLLRRSLTDEATLRQVLAQYAADAARARREKKEMEGGR